MGEIECIAASHGHWDHMAGLPATIGAIIAEGGKVTVHVNPGMFNERGVRLQSGAVIPVVNVPSLAELERHGATVVNDPNERVLLDGHFYYSGEIPRLSPFEKGRADHLAALAPMRPGNPILS